MKESLGSILEGFTRDAGQLSEQKMGGKAQEPNPANVARVSAKMSDLARSNGYIMNIAVSIVVALFAGCIGLVIYYRHTPNAAMLVMGGNGLQLLVLVGWLRRLWVEKTALETLLIATEELPPAAAAKLLTAFYFKAIHK